MKCPGKRRGWRGVLALGLVAAAAVAGPGVTGTEVWTEFYDAGLTDYALAVAIDSAGNVVSAGQSGATPGTDGYVERRLHDGTFDWRSIIDNPDTDGVDSKSIDNLLAVCVDPSDDVIVGGTWSGNYYGADGFWSGALVRKHASGGALRWEWKGNAGYGAWSVVRAVATDGSGNVYAAGQIFGNWGVEEHQWGIWKFDPDGNLQSGFPIVYDHSNSYLIADIAYGIAVDTDGSFVVVGQRGESVGLDDAHRNVDWHVRKYAADGTLLWEDTVLWIGHLHEVARAVAIDADGDVYVAGTMNMGTDNLTGADWDSVVVKYAKETGQRIWAYSGGTGPGENVILCGVAVGPADTLIVSGTRTVSGQPLGPISELLDANDRSVLASDAPAVSVEVGISAVAHRGGFVAIGGYATGPSTVEAMSSLVEIGPIPNRAPWIDQDPWADTTLAAVGESVGFHVRAHDPDGDPLTVHWEFNNAPSADGLDVHHTFRPSGGSYAVTATVSDGTHTALRALAFDVGDPFRSPRLTADLDFRKPRRDVLTLTCKLKLPAGFKPAGRMVDVDFGGVQRTFKLNSLGRSSTKDGLVTLTYVKSAKLWTLKVTLARGSYAAAWTDEGLVNKTLKNRKVTMKATVEMTGGIRCAHLVREVYNAKRGWWGRVR